MKKLLVLLDGMDDEPIASLGGHTPREVASMPALDYMRRNGKSEMMSTIPARITAFLMVLASGRISLLGFVKKYGRQHASPNSGYPESALAGILNCRFGGPHDYFGERVDKPYIGTTHHDFSTSDARVAIRINRRAEILAVILAIGIRYSVLSLTHIPAWL